jgi:hypothetical protein
VFDLNGDGRNDIFLAGNFYGLKPQTGRFDASYGSLFFQEPRNEFHYIAPKQSGIFVKGEVRDIIMMNPESKNPLILVARNNDSLMLFKKSR